MSRILPVAVPPTSHGLKYRLFYGRKNDRVVGYVNERGKATTATTAAAKRPTCFRRRRSCSMISSAMSSLSEVN